MAELKVEYFAAARELAGTAEERIAMERSPMSVADVLLLLASRHALLSNVIHRMRLAVNGEIAGDQALVEAGDEIAVLPPVAGGALTTRLCAMRQTPLSVDEVLAALSNPAVGGIALFVGTVRDQADGKSVARLDYEAHTHMAEQELQQICDELSRSQPEAQVAVVHRVGTLAVGDIAIIVGAGAAHRAEAFSACRAAIEAIKTRVPIWKKEWAPDGTANWVNLY